MIGNYPLTWPLGWPRTPAGRQRKGQFKTSLGVARDDLLEELRRFGARQILISTDVPTRNDGLFYASAREPDDPGVAVYFQWKGKPYQVACDTYSRLDQNVRAVFKTIEAWRTIERHGASQLLERVVSGFAALPPGSEGQLSEPEEPWWEVFEIGDFAGVSAMEVASDPSHPMRKPLLALVEMVYKTKIFNAHPDRGGSHETMQRYNLAIAGARKSLAIEKDES